MKIKTNMTGNFSKPGQFKASFAGLTRLSRGRQFGLVFGLAVCLSVAYFLVHWVRVDGPVAPAGETASQVSRNSTTRAESVQLRTDSGTSENDGRVWKTGQWVFGGMLAVLLLLGVFRPLMRDLASVPSAARSGIDALDECYVNNLSTAHGADTVTFAGVEEYEKFLNTVRDLARDDPKRVAQLLKGWLNETSAR